jgi:kojibiose phosphorylase
MNQLWAISETEFQPEKQHHHETIFTIGNGYLCTRGALEEGYLADHRATFIHGVFDEAPIVVTELANAPDWLPLVVLLNGERFSLSSGTILSYERKLDLSTGLLIRSVRWQSPSGYVADIYFERFASLADPHAFFLRCRIIPEFAGEVEFRAGLNGYMDNDGLAHWEWLDQGEKDGAIFLLNRTRKSHIQVVNAMRFQGVVGEALAESFWDVQNTPVHSICMKAVPGMELAVEKNVRVFASRDFNDKEVVGADLIRAATTNFNRWEAGFHASSEAWAREWERSDVIIEGDDEAQLSVRFNLFQILIAAPRFDDRVSIGAKTLSGFGYRGHAFWDTEIFILPFFIYTAPHIARNLLNYRYGNLDGARAKARNNGFEGAQFPWESADSGEEVTPTWVPHFADRTKLVRIWTGDIEIHISADISYAVMQYWKVTGDDDWMIEKGAEIVLDTAKFWASRAEWNAAAGVYEYCDVIGPDENHDHVDNNVFTNCMARWNLQAGLQVLKWLRAVSPARAETLIECLDLSGSRLARWRDVIERIYIPTPSSDQTAGLIEQFDGYFNLQDIDLASLEPRQKSVQELFGIEGAANLQVLKQPDVLMLQYLLREEFSEEQIKVNYAYYSPRTDHTYGSSLGPSIQAIMACEAGRIDEAYEHFIRAVQADLRDVRGNAGDGIHAASAAGTWQTVVFGFGGLKVTHVGWTYQPRLPQHWKRLAFRFVFKGELQQVDIRN